MTLSVIICTYNPATAIFETCLRHIQNAAGVFAPHEVLVIDNNSLSPVAESYGARLEQLKAKTTVTVIVEKEQGLTPARLRGIKEASGDVLIYIDDDNFIYPDFFLKVKEVAEKYTHIGAFSGQVFLQYEENPEAWVHRYSGLLVKRALERDSWSNVYDCPGTVPCGAGLVVLKQVAKQYLDLHESGKRPILLDRSKNSLLSGGDNDLAYCALDIGLGMGLFKDLKVDHYIPKSRTTREYLSSLAKWIAASSVVLDWYRNKMEPAAGFRKLSIQLYHIVRKSSIDRLFYKATLEGEKIGKKIIQDYENSARS